MHQKAKEEGRLQSSPLSPQVSKTSGETFEQTLTTCATSDITVAPHSHYTATMVMEERSLLADFQVSTETQAWILSFGA